MTLEEEFQRIRDNHRNAIIARVARVCFSGSTGRVFPKAINKKEKSANQKIKEALATIDVDMLPMLTTQDEFKQWFETKLEDIFNVISLQNSHGKNLSDGTRKWGYGAKILCLFVRDMIEHCRYFDKEKVQHLNILIYVPIDDIVIRKLRICGIRLSFNKIEEVDSPEKFYYVQETLAQAAKQVGVPRIWFDDNWGDRQ